MRRNRKHSVKEYLEMRIDQLKEDLEKARDPYDKQWYTRLIQELSWAHSQDHDCYMEVDKSS